MIWLLLAAFAWLGLGVWAEGYFFAYFQREYPTLAARHLLDDRRRARWGVLLGVGALWVALGDRKWRKHGWLWFGSRSVSVTPRAHPVGSEQRQPQRAPKWSPDDAAFLHAREGPIRCVVASSDQEAWNKIDGWGKK